MRILYERGEIDLPEAVLNRPRPKAGLSFFYSAFCEIDSCRQMGMSVGPIPYTAIIAWMNENKVVGEQREIAIEIILRLDSAYLKFHAKKAEEEARQRELDRKSGNG